MLYSYTNQYQFLADKQGYVRTVFETYHALVDVDGSFPPSKISQHPTAMQLALWDTAGQEQYNELRAMCYMKTDMSAAVTAATSGGSNNTPPSPMGASSSSAAAASAVNIVQLTPRFASNNFDVSVFVLCFSWNDPSSLTHVENKWYKEVVRFAKDVEADREASETSSDGGRRAAGKKKFTAPPSNGGGSAASGRPFVIILCGTKCDTMTTTTASGAAAGSTKGMVTYEQVDYVASKISADAVVSCSAKTGEGVKEVLDTAMKKWLQRVLDDLPETLPSQTIFSSICSLM
ncbi:ras-related GTP-binding protein, putative [Bodo saltans]|uniref:Ras-related GTP-binding protein, putative n=1 Tax=Bodo saltans TaxID=75058 RepID=A0A0S4KID2_BODSA|nr:ras-related GTP-binding protein, putative [Bodo saltans]|eukprot:CUI13816.1 ras-related GTP-binding protein, putative [Bodo saltans]